MKKLHNNFCILLVFAFGLFFSQQAKACDRSALILNGYTALPNGQYQIDLTFTAGAGNSLTQTGADQNTGDFAFFLSGGAYFVGYPATLTSPQTGAVYTGVPYFNDTVMLYENTNFQWWACISGCGPIQTVSQSLSIITQGLPNTIVLLGMEGASTPYGCDGPDMTIDFTCGNLRAETGGSVTVYPDIPAQACTDIHANATGGSGDFSYAWSNGGATASINVCPTAQTVYTVTVTDNQTGCTAVDAKLVNIVNCSALIANAGADQEVFPAYPAAACTTLNGGATGGSGSYNYLWNTGATTASINVCPVANTTYSLTVTDNSTGCSRVDNVTVVATDISCGNNKVVVCQSGVTRCVTRPQVPGILNAGGSLGPCKNKTGFEAESSTLLESGLEVAPNPCQGRTQVRMQVAERAQVSLSLYDLNGRQVKALVNETRDAGNYELGMDVSDLAPGLYFARMAVGDEGFTQKVVVQ